MKTESLICINYLMRETGEYPVIKLYAFLKTGNEILRQRAQKVTCQTGFITHRYNEINGKCSINTFKNSKISENVRHGFLVTWFLGTRLSMTTFLEKDDPAVAEQRITNE